MDPLLPNKFIRFLVKFRSEVPANAQSRGVNQTSDYKDAPDWNFAQQIILFLKLFHLSLSDSLIIRLQKVLFDFMPWSHVLPSQSNIHSDK
jgi:hypothetical protein